MPSLVLTLTSLLTFQNVRVSMVACARTECMALVDAHVQPGGQDHGVRFQQTMSGRPALELTLPLERWVRVKSAGEDTCWCVIVVVVVVIVVVVVDIVAIVSLFVTPSSCFRLTMFRGYAHAARGGGGGIPFHETWLDLDCWKYLKKFFDILHRMKPRSNTPTPETSQLRNPKNIQWVVPKSPIICCCLPISWYSLYRGTKHVTTLTTLTQHFVFCFRFIFSCSHDLCRFRCVLFFP